MCEKPFALDAGQALEMQGAAAKSGRTAMIAHEFRFTPQRAYIHGLLAEDYLGKLEVILPHDRALSRSLRVQRAAAADVVRLQAAGGGILGALGSHYVDALRHWFGEVSTVRGRLDSLRPNLRDAATGAIQQAGRDDTYSFALDFRNGGTATMIASFVATPARAPRIVVMGEKGTLIAEQAGPNRRKTESSSPVAAARRCSRSPHPRSTCR